MFAWSALAGAVKQGIADAEELAVQVGQPDAKRDEIPAALPNAQIDASFTENGVDRLLFDERDVAPRTRPARKAPDAGIVAVSFDSALPDKPCFLDPYDGPGGAVSNENGGESSQ